MSIITDNLTVGGHLSAGTLTLPANSVVNASVASTAAIDRAKLAQDSLKPYPVNFTDLRVWDAMHTVLPGTSAADDLALVGGTFGTNAPLVKTFDVGALGAQTLRARFLLRLPAEYVDGETVVLRISGGMETTVADTTATVDVEAHETNRAGGVGADIVATAAQSINSLTFADKDFTITPTTLVAGDILDVRITIAVNDAATVPAVIAALARIELLADVKG